MCGFPGSRIYLIIIFYYFLDWTIVFDVNVVISTNLNR